MSEVQFKQDTERQLDETHHDLSGSCAISYHNPAFQRGGIRGVRQISKARDRCIHNKWCRRSCVTVFIYNSLAKSEGRNHSVKVDWLVGHATVSGTRYGFPTGVESESFYAVLHPRGSMDDTLLNGYIESVRQPCLT